MIAKNIGDNHGKENRFRKMVAHGEPSWSRSPVGPSITRHWSTSSTSAVSARLRCGACLCSPSETESILAVSHNKAFFVEDKRPLSSSVFLFFFTCSTEPGAPNLGMALNKRRVDSCGAGIVFQTSPIQHLFYVSSPILESLVIFIPNHSTWIHRCMDYSTQKSNETGPHLLQL